MADVGIACAVGFVCFLAVSSCILLVRHPRDPSELPHARELIKCLRIVSGSFVVLLIPLFWEAAEDRPPLIKPLTSFGNGSSWNFGWGRPVGHFVLAFMGLFVDSHPALRASCMVGMMQAIVFDTLSSYDLGTQIDCVESGRCALPLDHTILGLRLLRIRDLASVAVATLALLLVNLLNLMIGHCRTRYTFRQLHTGDLNRVAVMRIELAKRNTTQWAGVHRSQKNNA